MIETVEVDCPLCGFRRRNPIYRDLTLSGEIKTILYQCQQCDKAFGHRQNLRIHVLTVHEGRRDYQCQLCEKTYTQKVHLTTHVSAVHEGKKLQCVLCEKRFFMKTAAIILG